MKKDSLIILAFILLLGCQSKSVIDPVSTTEDQPISLPTSTCASSLTLDAEVTQREGRVGYRDDLNLYYINVYLGGIDTSVSGLVCNMPDELKKIDQRVVFDGAYYTDKQLPTPRMGGETMRYLVFKFVRKK